MNKLITQLSDTAKKMVPHGVLSPDKWIMEYNHKFAELVIEECIKAFSNDECVRKHFDLNTNK